MTSTVEIVETLDKGALTRVKVKVQTDEIFSVDDVRLDTPDRASDYHQSLHTDRVTHKHNRRTTVETLWMENPYSQADLDAKIAELTAHVDATNVEHFAREEPEIQERCFVDGGSEKNFYPIDRAPQSLKDQLAAVFPDVDFSTIALLSTPSYHNVLEQDVITAFLWEWDVPALMEGDVKLITKARKYCMAAGKRYDRCYAFTEETFSFIPDDCTIMAKSFHVNVEDGLTLPDFYDVYFSGNADVVEAAFNLPHHVGHENTYYGVTVVDGEVRRAKQYCYDEVTVFSNWDEAMDRIASDHGITWG